MDMMMNNQVAGAAPGRSYYSNLKEYKALDRKDIEAEEDDGFYDYEGQKTQ